MRNFKCSSCRKPLTCTNAVWKERAAKFGSVDKMIKKYLCRDCRKTVKVKKSLERFTMGELITRNDDFKELKSKLKALVRSVNLTNKDAHSMKSFGLSVQNTMAEYNIHDYKFNIVNDGLKSIIINKIPFSDNLEINIEE